jgi:hypothetical protein
MRRIRQYDEKADYQLGQGGGKAGYVLYGFVGDYQRGVKQRGHGCAQYAAPGAALEPATPVMHTMPIITAPMAASLFQVSFSLKRTGERAMTIMGPQ